MTPQEQNEMEQLQRRALTEINSVPGSRAALEAEHGQVWDSNELSRDFKVLGFGAPVVVVVRKSDNMTGSLFFQANPRFYFDFKEDNGQ